MKNIFLFILLMVSFNTLACTDQEADDLVVDRAKAMARRYNAKKVGIGFASMLWGDTKVTNITILQGDGGTTGPVDRIGAIYVNMDTCVVKAKLSSIYDTIDVD